MITMPTWANTDKVRVSNVFASGAVFAGIGLAKLLGVLTVGAVEVN